jgi:hypothetical protein
MKILIHAGIHRTGTSSLQRFLHQNREILARHNITYPGTEIHHQKTAWALKRNPSDYKVINQLLENHGDSKLCVLSGEDFCIHTDLSWLAELASKHDVHALFYLRRQDHWVMSWYNQHIKWPFDRAKSRMSKDEFLASIDDFYWLDFHTMLLRWSTLIGKDKLSVAVIEPGQVEDVTSDFVQRAGLPSAELMPIERRDNDSLPVHVLEVARQLGLFELPPKARIRVISALTRGLSDKACPERTILSPEERTKILLKFEHSNRNVAKEFLSRDILFHEPPPAAGEPYFRFPEMSKEEFVAGWIKPVIQVLAKTRP